MLNPTCGTFAENPVTEFIAPFKAGLGEICIKQNRMTTSSHAVFVIVLETNNLYYGMEVIVSSGSGAWLSHIFCKQCTGGTFNIHKSQQCTVGSYIGMKA
ncbi:MAG: hypothetical protein MUO77_03800 [Anaerolineales bacterium]|nr:hypothetical protein [Anaerolineales bacterium]